MSSLTATAVRTHCDDLEAMLREIGLVLMSCDLDGTLSAQHAKGRRDWLTELVRTPVIIRRALAEAAIGWRDQISPAPVELVPGLWCAPVPVRDRRSCVGWVLLGIPTRSLLESEHLSAMCQAISFDARVCKERLRRLGVPAEGEVPRLAAMFSRLWVDRQARDGREQTLEQVGRELAETWEEINLLYSITDKMRVEARPHRFAAQACQELLQTLPYRWVAAYIDREGTGEGRLIVSGDAPRDRASLRTMLSSIAARRDLSGPVMAGSVAGDDPDLDALGTAGIAHPIGRDGKVFGLLVAGDKQGPDVSPSSVDIKLLAAASTHIAIHMENAGLFDDMNSMFLGMLEAITSSIDAKDRYTCGHSRRVALLTRQLAEAAGIDGPTVQRMHIAGLVHDVGKIGVRESVLCKQGRLTEGEYDEVRRHPDIGWHILKDIPDFDDILDGVRHHHERWDGGGYPAGLSGEEIPLPARLIALADAFDAMCSSRTYRAAMARDEVLDVIEKAAGTQFDPSLVPHFLTLDFTEWAQLIEDHRGHERPAPLEDAA
ncbi:MAG: HD domain-containing protein [Phycisphaerales bacterium]|jgi:HD-GYP domain-containing protein (c-di-GMP phosphodiesterase class II)|nr:HD domain-containing protein [Phycisphaerales bacterium]